MFQLIYLTAFKSCDELDPSENDQTKPESGKVKVIDEVMKFYRKSDKPNHWKCTICSQIKPVNFNTIVLNIMR